ncbi:hypothetical protein JTB14_003578 [Gonioctena quinquepunctata]|nr:hypothetical protein JTB14_003578 [Gonioctena quinquepunctata]
MLLKNATKLKGTKIGISNDLTIKQRKAKILQTPSAHEKLNGRYSYSDKLIIDGSAYTASELEEYEIEETPELTASLQQHQHKLSLKKRYRR